MPVVRFGFRHWRFCSLFSVCKRCGLAFFSFISRNFLIFILLKIVFLYAVPLLFRPFSILGGVDVPNALIFKLQPSKWFLFSKSFLLPLFACRKNVYIFNLLAFLCIIIVDVSIEFGQVSIDLCYTLCFLHFFRGCHSRNIPYHHMCHFSKVYP